MAEANVPKEKQCAHCIHVPPGQPPWTYQQPPAGTRLDCLDLRQWEHRSINVSADDQLLPLVTLLGDFEEVLGDRKRNADGVRVKVRRPLIGFRCLETVIDPLIYGLTLTNVKYI